ncbi:tagaturonate reductase [Paracnuella aquatica]|uniref:tagaturonate reductase n=1 Tax=Paracnuella aquatica TaxID=2268757 RepID=UPI000DF0126E|nr:tagaturonate reductase [Paracnuella aquatica]
MKLSRSNLKHISAKSLSIPNDAIFSLPEKVLQFGTGVLLRGLPDYFIDKANKMGLFNGRVVVVKSTAQGSIDAFETQDGLYTLCIRGVREGKAVSENGINASISRVLNAASEWSAILECAHNPELQIIISNTTEAGFQLVPDDIHAAPPASFPGKLLAFLYQRYQAFGGSPESGMVIVPTELVPDNGTKLAQMMQQLAQQANLEPAFAQWLQAHNRFCNSLVDCIVPGIPDTAAKAAIEKELGYEDALLTMSEAYRLWAIEGDDHVRLVLGFAAADPSVLIAPDIRLHRELKLRLLNATHTLSCAVAFLAPFATVKDAMNNAGFTRFLTGLMLEEIAPAIPYPVDASVAEAFGRQVLDRFRNPHIRHQWLSISVQYTAKIKARCVPLLLEHYSKNATAPQLMALGFAGYLAFSKAVRQQDGQYFGEWNGQSYPIQDDQAATLFAHWQKGEAAAVVQAVLSDTTLWGTDLTQLPLFSETVLEHLMIILAGGLPQALQLDADHAQPTPEMKHRITKIHPDDNVLVALANLEAGETLHYSGDAYTLPGRVPAKHKFVTTDLQPGDPVYMYGVLVGKAHTAIVRGGVITTSNLKHAASPFTIGDRKLDWPKPDVSKFANRTFSGYHRRDGKVGTANYWVVIPMVFCENRNLDVLRESLVEELGFGRNRQNRVAVAQLVDLYKSGASVDAILNADLQVAETAQKRAALFPNVDGIKFLTHDGGCGGTRQDAQALCGLLAGYIAHPNVAGATVLSLGCQNAQAQMLLEELAKRDPSLSKPVYVLEQQAVGTEANLISEAIKQTFAGLVYANSLERKPAPLSKLCIGLECGGSDGFSGISANPAIGYTSDLLVALGGSVILSEFPELCGAEQNISDRCVDTETAQRFAHLMQVYNQRAVEAGSGFDMNPSPGNIKDGLITDAIKSAGAAKKGGTSPVVAVLDYPELVTKPGLNLLCTPGNDVESTTAEVASGANVVLFTTGLGTPTGNPVAPVVKISSNTALAQKMHDIIDIDTGTIIDGEETIEQAGERILEYVIRVASGEQEVCAVRKGQDDFIPWKRGVSL